MSGPLKIVENLQRDGFIRIHSPTFVLADTAMDGFLSFLKESQEFRKLWTFNEGTAGEYNDRPAIRPQRCFSL